MKQAASIHDLKLLMLPPGITVSSSIDYRLHLGKKNSVPARNNPALPAC